MIVYTDRDFLANLDYDPEGHFDWRVDAAPGSYECTYETVCATHAYMCEALPEFYFMQIRRGEVVTALHVKNRGYYNRALDTLSPLEGAPHPSSWHVLDGCITYIDDTLVCNDATAWFDNVTIACNLCQVSDVDIFVNPYHVPLAYDPTLLPVVTMCHGGTEMPALLPATADWRGTVPTATVVGMAMWMGRMTTDAAMGLASLENGTDLVLCNTEACTKPLLLHNKTITDADKRATRVDNVVPPCDYMVHLCDGVDAFSLLDKFTHILKPVLLVGACSPLLPIRPWEHYVPVSEGMHDLMEGIEWCRSHPLECQRMTEAAGALCADTAFKRAFADALNGAARRCRQLRIVDPLYAMASWQRQYLDVTMHATADACIEPYPGKSLMGQLLPTTSYAYARGLQDLVTHDAFAYDKHCSEVHGHRFSFLSSNGDETTDYMLTLVNNVRVTARAYKRLDHMMRDYVFATQCTNPLRRHCANFQYVYSAVSKTDRFSVRVLCEALDGPTLAQWIASSAFEWPALINMLARLVLSLSLAFDEKGFMHYDLTAHSVVVVPDERAVEPHALGMRQYRMPTMGVRPVIRYMGNASGAVYHAGYGGVCMHRTHDMMGTTVRECLDAVTLVVHCLDTARTYGHDVYSHTLTLYDEFFGYRECFESRLGTYGSMWRRISSTHTLSQYAAYLTERVLGLMPEERWLPNDAVRVGYHRYLVMCAMHGTNTKKAWTATVSEMERTSLTPSGSVLHSVHVRCCLLISCQFAFMDRNVPPGRLIDRWNRVRTMLLDSLPVCTVPMHVQQNDTYCRFLTGGVVNVDRVNWLLCVEAVHDLMRCPPPNKPTYHAVSATLAANTGMLLHSVGCSNIIKYLEN